MLTELQVYEFIADELAIDVVRAEDLLSDLPIDSLDYIDLLAKLEVKSGIDLPQGKMPKFAYCGQLAGFFTKCN